MDTRKKVTISWSGGKDSAFALYKILQSDEYEVVHLHTIINESSGRVGMHGIPEAMIERQAQAIGIPLVKAYLAESQTDDLYTKLIQELFTSFREEGITHVVYGDIFLEDLKRYREDLLHQRGLGGIFPLWNLNSESLIREFVGLGFKTIICAANEVVYQSGLIGKIIDKEFISQLPKQIDPCGENGEFHTMLFDAPFFKNAIPFAIGEIVTKEYTYNIVDDGGVSKTLSLMFYFQEIIPAGH